MTQKPSYLKLPINLDALLLQRTIEGERVEYKAKWNPKPVLHSICAFANDFHNLGGGYIILGVEEKDGLPKLPPKGISAKRIDAIQKEVLNLGYHAIQPYDPTFRRSRRPFLEFLYFENGETSDS